MGSTEMYFKCLYVSSALILGEYPHFQDCGIQLASVSNLFIFNKSHPVSQNTFISYCPFSLPYYVATTTFLYTCYLGAMWLIQIRGALYRHFLPTLIGVLHFCKLNLTYLWKAGFDVQLLPSVGCALYLHFLFWPILLIKIDNVEYYSALLKSHKVLGFVI